MASKPRTRPAKTPAARPSPATPAKPDDGLQAIVDAWASLRPAAKRKIARLASSDVARA